MKTKLILSGSILFLFILLAFGSEDKEAKNNKKEESSSSLETEQVTINDVPGTYNNFEISNQLRLKAGGVLEFYTATSVTPYSGTWRLEKNIIIIAIPTWISSELSFTLTKSGLVNDKGKLVWEKV
jgi:hypothetical protein